MSRVWQPRKKVVNYLEPQLTLIELFECKVLIGF